ncbi:LOW QUALITY PROTEIN: hypothetical protein QTO34_019283, partial [Cnephaeus nilssonii]
MGKHENVFPPEEIMQISNKGDMKTFLRKVVLSLLLGQVSGMLSFTGNIFKKDGLLEHIISFIPHLLGIVVFLVGRRLGNTQNKGFKFSQALAIWSYTNFFMVIAVSLLTYLFLLVDDLLVVDPNNCGLLSSPLLPNVQILDPRMEVPECVDLALLLLQPPFTLGILRIKLCLGCPKTSHLSLAAV